MKTPLPQPVISLMLAAVLSAPLLGAETPTYAQIVQERDQVLAEIVASREARHATGTADDESIFEARLALHTFRRDTATSPEKQVEHQQVIVGLHEKRLEIAKARHAIGLGDHESLLLTKEAWLAARQALVGLREERAGKAVIPSTR